MKLSPTKVTFNYPINQNSRVYSPKVVQSGYIVGEPLVIPNTSHFSRSPHLLSLAASRRRSATYLPSQQTIVPNYEAPKPSQFAPPQPRHIYASHFLPQKKQHSQDYALLLKSHTELQSKYESLQRKYLELKKQRTSSEYIDKNQIARLIQKYKSNVIQQCKLLVDRARLEWREVQLSNSRTHRRTIR